MARWSPNGSPRRSAIPIPPIRLLDARFDRYCIGNAAVERIATGMRWVEGPVWFGDHHVLVWSDIPNNRLCRWDEVTGAVSDFRRPSDYANGNTRDRSGRLISCEHGTRRVTRTEYDGSITVLMDQLRGQAAERAERRDRRVRRLRVVHRPGLRNHVRLRGSARRLRVADRGLPDRSQHRRRRGRRQRSRAAQRFVLLAG